MAEEINPRKADVNKKRYNQMLEGERNPLVGIFSNNGQKGLDIHKLDFLKLSYKQSIDRMTQELLDQVKTTDLGKDVLQNSDLGKHRYVADIAVAKISKNLA